MARTKSPKYPNYPLSKAIRNARKIFDADRTSPLPREVIAKHLGYSGLSGTADGAIATVVQYGLLERTGKSEMRLSQLAVDIIAPEDEQQKQAAINRAAFLPPLFSEIWGHFDKRKPSDEALRIYLLRREFNDRAIEPILRSFEETLAMVRQTDEVESSGSDNDDAEETHQPEAEEPMNHSVAIGDYIMWASQGQLQFKEPRRVRWVSGDRAYVAVDGSRSGIPINEITVEKRIVDRAPSPIPPIEEDSAVSPNGHHFAEWFRAKVGPDKLVTINYKGDGEIGPREIEKMIAILEAQKAALED